MYQKFQVKPCFIYDEEGLYCNDSMWIIPTADKYLLGVLNSKVGWYAITQYCTKIQNGYQLIYDYLRKIPIAIPTDIQKSQIESLVNQILADKKEGKNTEALEAEVDALVYALYGLTEAEKAVVEGRG
jgi:adenine-specific DNA-methyltransferase